MSCHDVAQDKASARQSTRNHAVVQEGESRVGVQYCGSVCIQSPRSAPNRPVITST